MPARKVKLSVSVSRDLVDQLDREVDTVGSGASRSSVLELWLRAASRTRARDRLAEQTAHYYRTRSAAQESDDDAWANAASREFDRVPKRRP